MASVPATDPFIVFAPDVPEEEGHYPPPFEKERVGFWRNLGKATGSKSLGFGIDRIPPGAREVPGRAGHVVSFVAGTRLAHCFVNRSAADCRLFTVGERKPDIEKSFYAEDLEYDAFFARERPTCHRPKDE